MSRKFGLRCGGTAVLFDESLWRPLLYHYLVCRVIVLVREQMLQWICEGIRIVISVCRLHQLVLLPPFAICVVPCTLAAVRTKYPGFDLAQHSIDVPT